MGNRGNAHALTRFVRELQILAGAMHAGSKLEACAVMLSAVDNLPSAIPVVERRTIQGLTVEALVRLALRFGSDVESDAQSTLKVFSARSTAELQHAVRNCIPTRPRGSTSQLRAERAVAYIKAHFTESQLDLASVASALRLSRWHLSRLLRREGVSFRELRRRQRMASAVRLLADVTLSIKEVAARLGYPHATEFDRDFRRAFGMTPTTWQRCHRRDDDGR